MLLTQRAACARLGEIGLSRRHALTVLGSGLAGTPQRAGGVLLHDAAAVEALVSLPSATSGDVDRWCPRGLFVARRPPGGAAVLGAAWPLSPWLAVWLGARIAADGPLPFVATVGGFAHHVAVVTTVTPDGPRTYRLALAEPTGRPGWVTALRTHRIPTGPGRPWVVHGDPLSRSGVGG